MPTDNQKNDATKLIYLLDQFNTLLTKIIDDKSLFKNERIYTMIKEQWDEKLQMEKPLPSLAGTLIAGNYTKELENVGLSGKQLSLKFNIFNSFFYGEIINEDAIKLIPRKPFTLTKRMLAAFFDFFNSFLGSLGIVIPMTEALKEFKDMVHFEIDYGKESCENSLT